MHGSVSSHECISRLKDSAFANPAEAAVAAANGRPVFATWIQYGITLAYLGLLWHYFGSTLESFGIPWPTLAYLQLIAAHTVAAASGGHHRT